MKDMETILFYKEDGEVIIKISEEMTGNKLHKILTKNKFKINNFKEDLNQITLSL